MAGEPLVLGSLLVEECLVADSVSGVEKMVEFCTGLSKSKFFRLREIVPAASGWIMRHWNQTFAMHVVTCY